MDLFKSDDHEDMFSQVDGGVDSAVNTPAKLFRSMIHARDISAGVLDSMVSNYVKRKYRSHDKHRSSTKSNIHRALLDRKMSWGTFMRAANILRLKKLTITCEVRWNDDLVTYHQHVIVDDANGGNTTLQSEE